MAAVEAENEEVEVNLGKIGDEGDGEDGAGAAGEYQPAGGEADQIEPSVEYDPAPNAPEVSLPAAASSSSSSSSTTAPAPAPAATTNTASPSIVDSLSHAATVAPSTVVERPHSPGTQEEYEPDEPRIELSIQTGLSASNALPSPLDGALSPGLAKPLPAATRIPTASHALPRARLAHDIVGILEDRVKEDPRGDTEAWLDLIEEHKTKGRFDDARKTYDRFFEVFPQAADQWVAYLKMEDEYGTRGAKEALLQRALEKAPTSLRLWMVYLDHIRRYFPLHVDTNSQIVHRSFQEVVKNVGVDKDAGQLWIDYIAFTKSGPGVIGGNSWVDGQKMDQLRKVYHQAICVPTEQIETIWKEYSAFEMGLNKVTGRKFLQERSPDYMTARGANVELRNMTQHLDRTTLSGYPPAPGFAGDEEYRIQVAIWTKWIQWEKDDPLVFKTNNFEAYKKRVLYAYKQALMALRFWPDMWYDAAEFCFDNNLDSEGTDFLDEGIAANPASCLLAFRKADRLELTTTNGNDDESKEKRGVKVREAYDKVLDELYRLHGEWTEREAKELARLDAEYPNEPVPEEPSARAQVNGDDADEAQPLQSQSIKTIQMQKIKETTQAQKLLLSRSISHTWIAAMRAFQRMQGKGNPKATELRGSRGILNDARRRGRITSEVWIAAALLEYQTNEQALADKLFDRAVKLFPDDETLFVRYLQWLTSTNDHQNARVRFEKFVQHLSAKAETQAKAKPLYAFFHQYESQYGELAQIVKLEKRMREAFPNDPKLSAFTQRFRGERDGFDATAARLLLSPRTQTRPKGFVGASAAAPPSIREPSAPLSPSSQSNAVHRLNSPKRAFPLDDFDDSLNPPRKIARGESPLAGAAGRRLDNMRRMRHPNDVATPVTNQAGAGPALPVRDIMFLLSIIPPASAWPREMMQIPPEVVVKLLGQIDLPASANLLPPRQPPPLQQQQQQQGQYRQAQQQLHSQALYSNFDR